MAAEEVTVRASLIDDISAKVEKIDQRMENLDRTINKVGRDSREQGAKGLGQFVSVVDSADKRLASLAATGLRLATYGIVGLTGAVAGFGLKASATFENTQIAFDTMLNSADAGKQLFSDLKQYDLSTAFNLPQIDQAAQLLLQFGIAGDRVLPTLKALGDVASGTANPGDSLTRMALALGQIQSAGVLRAQDLNQLIQSGLPAYQVAAQAYGISAQQLRQTMDAGHNLPSAPFVNALVGENGVLARYSGMAAKQATTLTGVWSNFTDTIRIDLANNSQGFVDDLKKQMPIAAQQLDHLLQTVGPPMYNTLDGILQLAIRALPRIEAPLSHLFGSLDTLFHSQGMKQAEDGFIALVGVLPNLVTDLSNMMPMVGPMSTLIGDLGQLGGAHIIEGVLAWKAVSTIVTPIIKATQALRGLTVAEVMAGTAGGGAGGAARAGLLGKVALGLGGAAVGTSGVLSGGGYSFGGFASSAGGFALSGGMLGSKFGPFGALAGTLLGGAAGAGLYVGGHTSKSITVHPGAIQVNNPASTVDVNQAFQDFLTTYVSDQQGRQ